MYHTHKINQLVSHIQFDLLGRMSIIKEDHKTELEHVQKEYNKLYDLCRPLRMEIGEVTSGPDSTIRALVKLFGEETTKQIFEHAQNLSYATRRITTNHEFQKRIGRDVFVAWKKETREQRIDTILSPRAFVHLFRPLPEWVTTWAHGKNDLHWSHQYRMGFYSNWFHTPEYARMLRRNRYVRFANSGSDSSSYISDFHTTHPNYAKNSDRIEYLLKKMVEITTS